MVEFGQHRRQIGKGDRHPHRSRRRADAPGQRGGVEPDGRRKIFAADRANAAAKAPLQLRAVGLTAQPDRGCGDADQQVAPGVERQVGVGAGVEQGFQPRPGRDQAASAAELKKAAEGKRERGAALAVEGADHLGRGREPEAEVAGVRLVGDDGNTAGEREASAQAAGGEQGDGEVGAGERGGQGGVVGGQMRQDRQHGLQVKRGEKRGVTHAGWAIQRTISPGWPEGRAWHRRAFNWASFSG